jgi:carboxypeptidase family protein
MPVLSPRSFFPIIPVLAAALIPLPAQVGTASLGGFVTDSSGASIPKASVTLKSVLQKYTRDTVTSNAGEYAIPALPPGDYELVVSAPGFLSATRTGIRLSSGQASALNVQLSVAGATEQITVSEAPPLLPQYDLPHPRRRARAPRGLHYQLQPRRPVPHALRLRTAAKG